jgi:hypothetical protein
LTHRLRAERAERIFHQLGETKDYVKDGVMIVKNMIEAYKFQPQCGLPQRLHYGTKGFISYDCVFQCAGTGCKIKSSHDLNFHPLINEKNFSSILQGYARLTTDVNEERLIRKVFKNLASIEMWTQAKIRGDSSKRLLDFQIKANNKHNYNHNESEDARKCLQFSFVMVDFGSGEEELCQVLSIVRIEGTVRGLDLVFVVLMEECDLADSHRKYILPYKSYKYAWDKEDRSCLSCHAVSFNYITGPAFVISGLNTSAFNSISVSNFESQFFYCIPHERILGTHPYNYTYLNEKYATTFWSSSTINRRDAVLHDFF